MTPHACVDRTLATGRALMWALAGLLVLVLAACMPQGLWPGSEEAAPPLVGTVSFPTYRVQATIGDVASASTVTLIDATTNVSQATTLTDASGSFSLSFTQSRFRPVASRTYYLEATKGLGNNVAGKDAARVRTLVLFEGGWQSITSAAVNSPINLNEGTTALSVIASHKGPTAVPPASLMGKLTTAPEAFTPVTNVTNSEFTEVRSLVNSLLLADGDPIALIGYEPGAPGRFVPKISGNNLTATPTTLSVTETVTLQGLTFDPTLTNNVVTFTGGVAGTVTGISGDRRSLTVQVPVGATTGMVTVRLNGQIFGIPSLTILGTLNAGLY